MDDNALPNSLQRIGLGEASPLRKALVDICGRSAWPTANILVSCAVLWRAMGKSIPDTTEERRRAYTIVRTKVSQLKSAVQKKWRLNERNPIQAIYALTFTASGTDEVYAFFIFEETLAEHVLAMLADPATGEGSGCHQKDRRDVQQMIEGFFGYPLSEMPRRGLPVAEGIWRFPFGIGSLTREQLTDSITYFVTGDVTAFPNKELPRLVGLWGLSGIGKTTLACRVRNEKRIKEIFGQRIYWATVGKRTTRDKVKSDEAKILSLLKTDIERNPKRTLGETTEGKSLQELSTIHPFLLILDDLHSAAQTEPFRLLGSDCCLLAISRSRRVLDDIDLPRHLLHIPPLSTGEAFDLFTECAGVPPGETPGLRDRLINLCSGIPLAIKIAGFMVRRKPTQIASIVTSLESELDGVKAYIPDYTGGDANAHGGQTILAKVIEAAIEDFLTEREKERLMRLSVVPAKVSVPYQALTTFWSTDTGGVERFVETLADLALIEHDSNHMAITLHDMIHAYLQQRAQDTGQLRTLHRELLSAYAQKCSPDRPAQFRKATHLPWYSIPPDGYFYENLACHLVEAGHFEQLTRLLLDFQWLRLRLRHTNVDGLISDYEHHRMVDGPDLVAIKSAIVLSVPVLIADPSQLGGQLYGRLLDSSLPGVITFREQLTRHIDIPWLRPLLPALNSPSGYLARTLYGHRGAVLSLAVTPDGSYAVSGSEDKSLIIWDLRRGSVHKHLRGHGKAVTCVAITKDGCLVVSGSADRTLRVWDLQTGELLHVLDDCKAGFVGVTTTGDSRRAISASSDGTIWVWDLESGAELFTINTVTNMYTNALCVTPDGRYLVSIARAEEDCIQILDLQYYARVTKRSLECRKGTVFVKSCLLDLRGLAMVEDGSAVVLLGMYHIAVLDLRTHELRRVRSDELPYCFDIAVSEDGRYAVLGSGNGSVLLVDIKGDNETRILCGNMAPVNAVAFAGNTGPVVSGSTDCTVRTWKLQGRVSDKPIGPAFTVCYIVSLPDGEHFIVGYGYGFMEMWSMRQMMMVRSFGNKSSGHIPRCITPDGNYVVTSHGNDIYVWDIWYGEEAQKMGCHSGEVFSASTTPDGMTVVSGSDDHAVIVWDVSNRRKVQVLTGHQGAVFAVRVMGKGRQLVSASEDGTLKIWDLSTRNELRCISGGSGAILDVGLLNDGDGVISASGDGSLHIWNLRHYQRVHSFHAHSGPVNFVSVSPDERLLASTSADTTLKIWDLSRDYALVATYYADCEMGPCIWGQDGRTLVVGDRAGRLHFLNLEGIEKLPARA